MFDDLRLDRVERPSRYVGGEVGMVRRNPADVRVHMALAFPDLYEIGMSSTGFHILQEIANKNAWALCERVFAPAKDMLAEMRRAGVDLYGLETKTPVRRMDVMLVSIQYELACTNVVLMLDAAGIPRRAEARKNGDPLVIAGGHCASNPEPWAPFFDALVIGDGEEVVVEILEALDRTRGADRAERLEAIGRIEGIYLPHHWRPRYAGGKFAGFDRDARAVPAKRRIVMNLDDVPHTTCPTLPNTRLVHDRLAVEIMRGCTRGCRFCQPGMLTRPMRERSVKALTEIIEEGLAKTGHDEVTLLSLSSGDYTQILPLLTELTERHADRHISISLPSLRAEAVNAEVFEKIGRVRKSGFTIAPEAGTERLRAVLNKPISDQQILDACRAVNSQGWYLAKLYFMVGLPTETPDDLDAILDLCFRVLAVMRGHGHAHRAQVNVNVGTFVPKPFTPFAWERQLHYREAWERLDYLKARTRRTRVELKGHDARMSFIEGIIGRGDRRVADAIERVVDTGGGFDGWTEHFSVERWEEAFAFAGVDVNALLAGYAEDDPLPWDGVDAQLEKKFLLKERRLAYEAATTDDCRWAKCTACGSCDFDDVKNQLAEDYFPVVFTPRHGETPPDVPAAVPPTGSIISRYRVRYGIRGEMRFLGHLELMPIVHRVLRRAGIDVAYTQGFSPQPRVAFGPPISAGIESEDEYLDLFVHGATAPEEISRRLRENAPEGLPIFDVRQLGLRDGALFQQIAASEYHVDLHGLIDDGALQADTLTGAVERFTSAESWPVEIPRKKGVRRLDAKQAIDRVSLIEDRRLALRILHRPDEGGIRPASALALILAIDEAAGRRARWTKTRTYFNPLETNPT